MLKIENYIDGELVEPVSENYLDNFNPATGEIYSLIADSDERDVEAAVEAARKAFPAWSKMSAEQRHDCLMRIVSLIERDLDLLAFGGSRPMVLKMLRIWSCIFFASSSFGLSFKPFR
jgi:aminomuconate-semialdehyde/2-hydroxymuconate-6-semialdehyde dehydrogenase